MTTGNSIFRRVGERTALRSEHVVTATLLFVFLISLKPLVIQSSFTVFSTAAGLLAIAAVAAGLYSGVRDTELTVAVLATSIMLFFMYPGERGVFGFPVFSLAGCVLAIIATRNDLHRALNWLVILVILLCLPGIIQYVVYMSGGDLLGNDASWMRGNNFETGKIYFGNVVTDDLVYEQFRFRVYRFQGIFDEPGLLGTTCALLLSFRGYKLKNLNNFLLFAMGVASLSLAFIAISMLFALFSLVVGRRARPALIFLAIGGGLVIGFWEIASELPFLSRLASVETVADLDNRTSGKFEAEFAHYMNSDNPWRLVIGYGNAAHTTLNDDLASWKAIIYNHGFLGAGLLGLLVLLMLFAPAGDPEHGDERMRSRVLFFCVCASFYQRPEVFSPLYFALLTAATLKSQRFGKGVSHWKVSAPGKPRHRPASPAIE